MLRQCPSPSRATRSLVLAGATVLAALNPSVAPAQGSPMAAAGVALQAGLPRLVSPFRQAVAAAVAEDPVLSAFYRGRDYAPFWTGAEDAPRRAALMAALAAAPLHGLPLRDGEALRSAFAAARSEGDRGRLDVAMTRAFLRHVRAARAGVLVPRQIDPGLLREVAPPDPAETLEAFAAAAEPAAFLRALMPATEEYARLVRARMTLVSVAAQGGWGPAVPSGALRPGDTGPGVIALRDRLVRMGYLAPTAAADYGPALTAAVQAVQFAHGLTPDGVAGEATIAAINVPLADRLGAIAVAMERERWLGADRGARHIWVNLADFSAKVIDDGKVTFATKAVIGATLAEKNTPEFSRLMTYMEVNPDWTVPPGIIRRDYLPKLQSNPNALGHLQVVDARGRVVPRDQIDFAAYSARNFPFNLRQPPGATNALGRVKFMFPNPWSIYLHDTPERHLFARESRAYSSGCVRLNDPFDFAYVLLARQEADPRAAFHRVLDSGRQERIFLAEPVPIHLDYRTAFTGTKGELHFRRDIYGRDGAILAALVKAGVDPAAMPR
ncbi:MAG: murein L,D-transpeptidase [Gemmobacter sp.]